MSSVNGFNPTTNDQQTAQQTSLATQFPNSVDALPGMQYPDAPGGPDGNARISPYARVHPATATFPPTPQSLGLPAYGSLGTENFEAQSEE